MGRIARIDFEQSARQIDFAKLDYCYAKTAIRRYSKFGITSAMAPYPKHQLTSSNLTSGAKPPKRLFFAILHLI